MYIHICSEYPDSTMPTYIQLCVSTHAARSTVGGNHLPDHQTILYCPSNNVRMYVRMYVYVWASTLLARECCSWPMKDAAKGKSNGIPSSKN